jgi:REP element-mobilizing transposase RayT
MITLFQNKYRIRSTKLKGWDYSHNGMYSVTICTKGRESYFGEIKDKRMKLLKIGETAQKNWQEIPKHFPDVSLDEFIIMPNHIHGIIMINNVETQNFASLHHNQYNYQNKFGPQSKNLSSIIRGFKTGVKKWATMNNIFFQWQPGFYDHIIRNEKSLNEIREYIRINPLKWEFDKNNPGQKGNAEQI